MVLGPGAAASFYVAMSGFYIETFKSRSFFISMLLCLMVPQPVVSLLQQRFDSFYDSKFSTVVTYTFRVIAMQLILASMIIVWMFTPNMKSVVLVIGLGLGSICGALASSSMQMVAALESRDIIFAKLGLQFGGLLPIVAFSCAGFRPTASRSEFQTVVASSVVICVLVAGILGYLHHAMGIFDKAYERLAYDLEDDVDAAENKCLLGGDRSGCSASSSGSMGRQQTPTLPLSSQPARQCEGVSSWIAQWQVCHALLMGMAMYVTALAGYFGDPTMAQHLSLLKLGMDLVGRILSVGIPYIPCFAHGPWHKVMATITLVGLCLGGVCTARLLGKAIGDVAFLVSWCGVFVLSIFVGSLLDVTSGCYSEVRDRKAVARTNQLALVSGLVLGLISCEATSSFLIPPVVA